MIKKIFKKNQYPYSLSHTFVSLVTPPSQKFFKLSAKFYRLLGMFPGSYPEQCGLRYKFLQSQSLLSSGSGSYLYTSNTAPAMVSSLSAWTRSSSFTVVPLPILRKTVDFFILLNVDYMLKKSSVAGTLGKRATI